MVRVLVAIAVLGTTAEARPVRGTITHAGQPVGDAAVLVPSGAAATSGGDGSFALEAAPDDTELVVIASGLATRTVAIDDVVAIELAAGGETIAVEGRAPDQTASPGYVFTADEIRSLPGAANDALRAVQALPGVARIPFSLGGLALRGSSPRDTAVYLDGIELPVGFHFGGVTSVYPSAMLAELAVTGSGFDASYGRSSGGLVTLATREPRTDRWRVGAEVGLFDSGAAAEGPLPYGGGILAGVRRSYLDAVAGPFLPDRSLPSYWDFQLRTTWGDARRGGQLTPLVIGSIDRVDSASTLTSAFVRVAAPYVRSTGATTLHVVPWLGWNRLAFTEPADFATQTFTRPVYLAGLRGEIAHDLPWGHVRGGVEANATWLERAQYGFHGGGNAPPMHDGAVAVAWTDTAAWSEVRRQVGPIAIKPGLRVERYALTGEVVVDPRLAIAEQLGAGVMLRQAIGRYHEPPTAGEVDPRDGNPRLASAYTDQAVLGVDAELPAGFAASLTGFYTAGHRLPVLTSMSPPGALQPVLDFGTLGPTLELLLEKELGFATYRESIGRSRSEGLELCIKHTGPRLRALISYTLATSERTGDPALVVGWRPFELDQRHNLNALASLALGAWRLGARLQAGSGNPATRTVSQLGRVTFDTLPPYVTLDLRVDHRWATRWGDLGVYLDLHNATNRTNIEGRKYDPMTGELDDTKGLPILPFVGVALEP